MTRKVQISWGLTTGGVPANPELFSARAMSELAVLAEQIGLDAVSLDDHPIPPEYWRQDPSGHDGIDPFAGLAAVAAATRRVRLFVNAAVVPYRNPFLLAKLAATLDVVSEGRLMLGLVAGYLPEEAAALGIDFATRGQRMDEAIEVLKLTWSGEPVTFKGRDFTAEAVTAQPRPIQRPHPPLWIGGNSQASLRRVIEHDANWVAHPNTRERSRNISRHTPYIETFEDFIGFVDRLKRMAAEAGRTEPLRVMHLGAGGGPKAFLENVRRLQDLDIDCWTSLSSGGSSLTEVKDGLNRLGDEILSKL